MKSYEKNFRVTEPEPNLKTEQTEVEPVPRGCCKLVPEIKEMPFMTSQT